MITVAEFTIGKYFDHGPWYFFSNKNYFVLDISCRKSNDDIRTNKNITVNRL